ncbi:MAG TPA: tetratricopeptide repeat protein [Polyangia bacterium]|jgi:tetratricopeptide (TPR) repeat protein|nr:tetratricopeptide repeat protein [Polyangia bacterium]
MSDLGDTEQAARVAGEAAAAGGLAEPVSESPPSLVAEVIPEAVQEAMAAARAAETQGIDKGIDAWRKLVQANPGLRTPRAELARLYRSAERWNALVELLKEQADKLPNVSPEEKLKTLFELVDIYRERLKLDVMVVNTYNAILAIQPGNHKALDALAVQYEQMKRWPDLISVLQKKAVLIGDAVEQVDIYSRIANLFQERFSNAAEAIKAYEKVLELDPQNDAAILFLKLNYEKRRDWEKLIWVHQREIDRIADPAERSARYVEVAKLASERLKKPSVSIELWAKVLDASPDHSEALNELEKLYEREKMWDRLAAVCERQVEATSDVAKKIALLQKLGLLFTDKMNDSARATQAWRALLDVDPENKRAQDALKKLYLTQKAWDELEAFYAAQGKIEEYVRVLERQVETEDAATKITLNTRIAELYRDELAKPDRAMRAYEKVLSLDEQNQAAAEALIPLYESAKDAKRLASVLEIQLTHTTDRVERLDRIRRLLELSEDQLHDKAVAYQWALKAFAEERAAGVGVDGWARIEAERLARETSGWPELVTAYELAYTAFPSATEALPLMATVARVYEEELGDTKSALETNQRILGLDESNVEAIAALERLYLKTQQYSELLKIYERKLSLESDVEVQKEIRYRIASLFEDELNDPAHAVDVYTSILTDVGDELPALRALDRIFTQTARWRELAEIIPRELVLVPVDDTAATIDLKFRLGALCEEHLADVPGAIECFRDLLELDPRHSAARERLERRLGELEHQLTVAGILEPIYEGLQAWERLVEVQEIQLKRETDPNRRVSLLLRIGELNGQALGDAEKAFDAYSRCFQEDPASDAARVELERIAGTDGRWEALVGLYEGALSPDVAVPLTSSLSRELLLKIADIYDEKLQRSDSAVENYRRVLSIEPDDVTALVALERLYTRQEQWAELLEIYRKKVELTDDREERERLYFQIAYLWEEALQNIDEAIATYKEVLGQDDGNLKALRALDRLYQTKKAWHELADNLVRQLSLTEDQAETIDLLVRLAALRERELGEVAAAVDTYRQVLDLDANNVAATQALERLLTLPEHEIQVASILEPIYQAQNEWSKLVGIYEIMVRHALDPSRKIELLHQIGELYEVGGDDAVSAFRVYDRSLREDPGLKETQARLERLARALGRWDDLVRLYREVASELMDQQLQVQLWTRVAQIYEGELANNEEAAAAYLRVLSADPQNLAAADALETIYLRTESYPKLVEVVLRKVEMIDDPAEKKQLCFKAAQIYEEVLENAEEAIRVFQMVLSFDENERAAIDALERLYIKLERWENLKDIYRKKAELATSLDEKKEIYFILGQVYDRELKDIPAAIETYQAILDLDSEDFQAIQALDRLYGQAERWYDLLQILEREVELSQSTSEIAALKQRVGQLWQHRLKDLARAVEAYREVLGLDAGHEPTLEALDGIVHGDEEPVLAAEVLEPIFEATGDWEKLIDVYEVMVRHADNVPRRVELLHQIAQINEQRLQRAGRAFEAYGRAFREDSTNEDTIGHLERLGQEAGTWSQLVGLYEEELKKLLEPSRQIEMLLRAARVYEEELGELHKGIAALRRILDVDPDERTAILSLDRLYQATQRWPELAEILRREIRLAQSDEEIIALLFRQGQLQESELKDIDAALASYREILASDPNHGPTLAALELLFADQVKQVEIAATLEPLYSASEQWEKLIRVHEVQLSRLEDGDERQSLLQRIAEIWEQRLGEPRAAFEAWTRALREAPLRDLPGWEVERLAALAGAWNEVVTLYDQILAENQDVETRRRVLLKLARVWVSELQDAARAEETYLRVLELDPKDADALAALDQLYEGSGMWSELADILARRIGITSVTDETIELQFRLGRIYVEELGNSEKAVAAYHAVLELEPRNARALESLERVFFQREQWAELYGVYEKMIDIAQGDADMAECYARMAKIAAEALGDRARAIELWNRVVDYRGEDAVALDHLASLYEQAQSWSELVEVIERRIRLSGNVDEQIRLYSFLGRVWLENLKDDQRALGSWQEVLALDASHLDALRAVAAIYRKLESWEDLVETLERTIEVGHAAGLNDDELRDLYARLGGLYEKLQRPQDAIESWKRVLVLDERNFGALAALEQLYTQEARWEECIEVLERKAEALADPVDKIAVLQQAAELWRDKLDRYDQAAVVYERVLQLDERHIGASEQLEAIYRNLGSWEKLVELLIQRTELVGTADARIALFQDVANIYETRLGDADGAFVVLQAAFKEDFSNDATSRELERLATAANKWAELLTDYTQVVQTITDPKIAASLWVKIGRWYGEHLGHLEYAIASEQQALKLDPNQKEALANLAEFYRKTRRWPELAAVLARHAELEEAPATRVDLYLALAQLHERELPDAEAAVEAYRNAVSADPACHDALDALERLYRGDGKWQELIDTLGHKAQAIEDTERLIALKSEIGELQDEKLSDTTRAIASFKEVLSLDPRHLPALRALERLYDRTGQSEQYLQVLQEQLDIVPGEQEKIAVYEKIAETWEQRFRRPERAWEALEQILVIDDRHEPTLRSLERVYAQERRYSELVDTLRRHIHAVPDAEQRMELYARMGEVYETELRDFDRAIEAYADILTFDANNLGALGALGRLYEKTEQWDRAIDSMNTQVELTDDPSMRVELFHRIGRILEERLGDPDGAEARYVEALSTDEGYVPAMMSLVAMYQRRGDWFKAAQMMGRAEAYISHPLEKVRLLEEAGRIYKEKLDDEARAGELFARVLEIDPEHVEAGEPLADWYFRVASAEPDRQDLWAALEPILDMLVRKAEKKQGSEMALLYYRLAKTAEQLGNFEKALKYYKLAYDIDPQHLPTLLGRAGLLYQQEDWDGAFKIYQTILVNQDLRDSQTDADIVEIFYRLGFIKVKQQERKKALNMFEKALEIDPTHRPTLLAVIDLQATQGDWEAVVTAKQQLLQVADDTESFGLLDELGDICHSQLHNAQRAIEFYLEALRFRPHDHKVLHKVLELYYETKQWSKVVEVLQQFTEIEKNPLIRGRYFEAAAKVMRDEINKPEEAIEAFNRALDCYFERPEELSVANLQTYLKAFQAIDKICTAQKDWKNEERNYRRMLKRMPADGFDPVKVMLWENLGEIYRSRLRDYKAATQAFEVAVKLDPGNVQRHEILAELYVLAGPDHSQKAVTEHMTLILREPARFESYKALRKLYMDMRQYDKAWCLCAVLNFMQRADAEEVAFYEQYRAKSLVRAKQRVTDEMWQRSLFHPDEDRYISAIYGVIWQAVALLPARSAEHKQFGLKRKDRLDLAKHEALFSKVFTYVAGVLGVTPMPEVFLRPEQQSGMQLANCRDKTGLIPSVVVGAELLQGRSDKELAFPIAKFLTMMRPEHYLKLLLQTNTELRMAFLAALKLVQPAFPLAPADAQVLEQAQYVQAVRSTINPAWLEQLGMVVQQFLASKAEVDLTRWSRGVELTAHRAAFVLCNDLTVAARAIQQEPTVVGGPQPKEKINELLLYAISEPYFELRQVLGLTIG